MPYKKRLTSFEMKKADTVAVLLFFALFIPFGILNLVDKRTPVLVAGSVWFDSLIAFGIFLVGLFGHEGCHALSAILFGKLRAKDISFGLDIAGGNLYTHFALPMKRNAYLVSLLLPVTITGILPFCLTVSFGGIILIAPCCLLIAGATGDFFMVFALLKEDKKAFVQDHPTAFAYYIAYPVGHEPNGFEERTEEEEKEELKKCSASPFTDAKGKKKSILLKCLEILVFIAVYMLLMYLISVLMQRV